MYVSIMPCHAKPCHATPCHKVSALEPRRIPGTHASPGTPRTPGARGSWEPLEPLYPQQPSENQPETMDLLEPLGPLKPWEPLGPWTAEPVLVFLFLCCILFIFCMCTYCFVSVVSKFFILLRILVYLHTFVDCKIV